MKKHITILFLAVVFITIAACKKYPDGPLFSLTTKETRLCKEWDVAYFSINGYDSTAYLRSQPFYGTYKFERPAKGDPGRCFYYSANSLYDGVGNWGFDNNKKSVAIDGGSGYTGYIGPYGPVRVEWDIMRLTQKELWLKTTYNGKEYFVKFHSI